MTAPYVVSPLQGIQNRAGPGVTVTSYAGIDPAQAAATAKAATVQSVTLPAISHGVGDSLNAMHVFAMGIGA